MNLKQKLESITSKSQSSWLKKSEDRSSKRWLKVYSSEIARRVIFLLKEKDMSQLELAQTLNVKAQRVNKIVKGKENLTLETIFKLSEALNFELITFPKYGWSYSEKVQIDYKTHQIKENENYINEIADRISTRPSNYHWINKDDLIKYKRWNTNAGFIFEAEIVKE